MTFVLCLGKFRSGVNPLFKTSTFLPRALNFSVKAMLCLHQFVASFCLPVKACPFCFADSSETVCFFCHRVLFLFKLVHLSCHFWWIVFSQKVGATRWVNSTPQGAHILFGWNFFSNFWALFFALKNFGSRVISVSRTSFSTSKVFNFLLIQYFHWTIL